MTTASVKPTGALSAARRFNPGALATCALAIVAALLVIHVEGVAAEGGRAAWSSSLVAGSAECMTDMGLRQVLAGDPCPFIGGTAGFPFILGGSESLAIAVLMRVAGMSDPYAAMIPVGIAICLLGFAGGVLFLRQLDIPWVGAIAGSTMYAIAPFTVGIQIFLGTGSGMLLLPLYAAADLFLVRRLAALRARGKRVLFPALAAYAVLRCFAVFLDGYTFLMSLLVAGGLLVADLGRRRDWRATLKPAAVMVAANGLGVLMYLHIAQGVPLEQTDLTIFRGWGMDIVTALQPNDQLQWGETVGLSAPRQDLYSDFPSTAWNYLGYLTLIIGATGVFLAVRDRRRWVIAIAAIGAIAGVLSLGPALKVDATVQPSYEIAGGLMPPGHPDAVELPWASVYSLPGISGMRYPYRWSGVTRLALIALAMFALARLSARRRRGAAVLAIVLGLLMAAEIYPNADLFRRSDLPARAMKGIRDQLVPSVRATTTPGMRVVFVDGTPVVNEYLANPVAVLSLVRAYNVGIDKNLFFAQSAWPPEVRELIEIPQGKISADDVLAALRSGNVDAVVFPDIDLVASINSWPTPANTSATREALSDLDNDPAVDVRRARHATTVVLD